MEARRLTVGCDFTYEADVPTPAVFQVRPGASLANVRSEHWSSTPAMVLRSYVDVYANPCTRVVLPVGQSSFRYSAEVEVPDAVDDADTCARETPPDDLPDETLIYTLPSRYCLPDVLGTESWTLFGALQPGYQRVQAICDHVHSHLSFAYGSSTPWSTAADVNGTQFGVCRDYAHLAISFCRALNIPARYVFGYLPHLDSPDDGVEMDFAAWMEVWLEDRWWTFDPRNNVRRKGRVVIGRGRDAADVAMATTFGGPQLRSMRVFAAETSSPS